MRLGLWHRIAVYTALAAVGLSGSFWFVLHDFVDEEPGEFTRWLLALHGISAFAVLLVLGSLFPIHIRAGWLNRRNIASGLSVAGIMTVLIVTALCLYYGGEDARLVARWVHIVVGGLGSAVVPIHVVFGHPSRPRNRAPAFGRAGPPVC
jgi:hypothetical protein